MNIAKPEAGTYPPYFDTYISHVKGDDLFQEMLTEHYETIDLVTSLDLETQHFRYAEGKWNIREIIQHLIDTERIFAYRALRFSRNDGTPLPGFDQDLYVPASRATRRDMNDLAREFSVVRASTIELFKSFDEEMLKASGNSNGKDVSIRAIMFAVLGHEIHHRKVIEERYLG